MAYVRITIDPRMMGGVPCIRNMRMPVATIVGLIAEGASIDEVLADHPELVHEDVREALLYAAHTARRS